MTKSIVATQTSTARTTIVNGFIVADVRSAATLENLPHGTLLIQQRADGHLYASRLLRGNGESRLWGIDADETATAAGVEGVEALMGYDAEAWLKALPGNYHQWQCTEMARDVWNEEAAWAMWQAFEDKHAPQGNNGEPLITSEWQPGDDALAEQAEYDAYMHSHPANGWGL